MKKPTVSKKPLADFPNIAYRRGASGSLYPVLKNTGIRVQTIVIASQTLTPAEIAEDYDLTESQVHEAINFYKTHRTEIDEHIEAESIIERFTRDPSR